ncbi:MAG TPA: PQQ-dependent sugar dehydrogenase [Chryseolinea sp.]|nr:PQQ-dependent sugar dehydrogenase [Chryseolinea sp.]HPM29066.1 PQQ-dependent sugar dehydrogenase [Chryseolinea sp.]
MHKFTAFVLLFLSVNSFVTAQNFPEGFSRTLVANGISNPTALAFAPDGRIFVAQQGGQLRVIKDGILLTTPFINLTVSSSGERGLIGVTLDPDFPTNHYLYLYYTEPGSPPHNKIIRVEANGDLAGTITPVLDLDDLGSATNHNGGAMQFGIDGKLYVAIGENANGAHAQDLDTYHGKLLRINKDGSIPSGNPFTTGSEQRQRVWSYGLRNPYTFDVQPVTGRIFVNDVGQSTWEEINEASTGGLNFGWPTAEGTSNNANFTNPVFSYPHGSGDGKGCAITGGTFFNPTSTNYPASYIGKYFFLEYCNNWINVLDFSGTPQSAPFGTSIGNNSLALTVGNDGNLYYLTRGTGALYKITYTTTDVAPTITQHPENKLISEGQPVTFNVSASGTAPLNYQWRKNEENILNTNSASYAIASVQPSDAGEYDVIVSNLVGPITSNTATLTVTAVNDPPLAVISSPVGGTTYVAGTSINFSGTGNDPEDGVIPAERFSWQIDFHHDTHVHDQPAIEDIKSGSFLIPDEGETSANVFYRITLTVTDSEGLTDQESIDLIPRKSTISLETDPEGLELLLDGQPFATTGSVVSVEGMKRTIGATTPQIKDEINYEFVEWMQGGENSQTIVTPTDNVTYTAKFSIITGAYESLADQTVKLYPNPLRSEEGVHFSVISNIPDVVNIQFMDMLSREVQMHSQKLTAGNNIIYVPLRALKNGVYACVIEINKRKIVKRLIVSRER